MTLDPATIVVRAGSMGALPLKKALEGAAKTYGHYVLSVQLIPPGDVPAQEEVWQHLERYSKACWSTVRILEAAGYRLNHTPYDPFGNHQGERHYDLVHPAGTTDEAIATVVKNYQVHFYGPGLMRSVSCEQTEENLRRLQQPDQP